MGPHQQGPGWTTSTLYNLILVTRALKTDYDSMIVYGRSPMNPTIRVKILLKPCTHYHVCVGLLLGPYNLLLDPTIRVGLMNKLGLV